MFVGQVICGGVVSRTTIVKLHTLVFPLPSVAMQTTVFVPGEKVEPEGGVQTRVTFVSQASTTVVTNVTGFPAGPAHSTTILLEHEISGGVVSIKVMVWVHVALLLQESSAFHVRVALKVPATRGLVMVEPTVMRTFVLPQKSMAVGAVKSQAEPHSTFRLDAQVRIGGLVFATRIS